MNRASLSFFVLASVTVPAVADPAPSPARITLGADGVVVLPIGDYANAASLAVGALGRLEVPAGPGFATVRGGAIFHALKTDGSLVFVPIYGGFRLPIGDGGLYAAGELGVTLAFASAGGASASDQRLGLTATIGLRRGPIDLRAGLFLPDVDHTAGLVGSLGYDFAGL
jgi:hypothetical protein